MVGEEFVRPTRFMKWILGTHEYNVYRARRVVDIVYGGGDYACSELYDQMQEGP